MQNTKFPHSRSDIFQNQEKPTKIQNALGDVRQDKRRFVSARLRSVQPARSTTPQRAQGLNTKTPRSQNLSVSTRKKEKLTLWVEPIVKAEIQRRAEREELSVSSVGAEALKVYLQHDADIHYSATLAPLIEATIDRRMSIRENRLAVLLVRNFLATEQNRILTTNLLGRQQDITPDALNDILNHSLTDAKKKLTRRSPEFEALIEEMKRWLADLSGLPDSKQGEKRKGKP